ncbi:hypothetical protein BDN72DRAFT_838005 [Pluteus cervinus]|uniref:Uncharacterized protein n=1 Tax=Pluteus cervinus TaxID=181527 RepID=A0ACD3AZQ6_9AGAR|nr:hypothetical protein BDN72DRAFT_838005 [Pluteus cervinus]
MSLGSPEIPSPPLSLSSLSSDTSSPMTSRHPLGDDIDARSTRTGPAYDRHRSGPALSAQPHERFFFQSDFVLLRIQSTQYYLPTFILSMHSDRFKTLLASISRTPGTAVEQIAIQDIQEIGFERLSSVSMPAVPGQLEPTSVEEWTSVLTVAHTWEFRTIQALALARIEPIASAVDKVVLGREYDLPQWAAAGYMELCQRVLPISRDEGRRLGVDIVTDISSIRDYARSEGGRRVGEAHIREMVMSSFRYTLRDNTVACLLRNSLLSANTSESTQPDALGLGEDFEGGGGPKARSMSSGSSTSTRPLGEEDKQSRRGPTVTSDPNKGSSQSSSRNNHLALSSPSLPVRPLSTFSDSDSSTNREIFRFGQQATSSRFNGKQKLQVGNLRGPLL